MKLEESREFELAEAERDYCEYTALDLHPLMDEDATHYDAQEEPTIQRMEREMTVVEMIGFCKGNIFKYSDRQDFKGQKEKDKHKINKYRRYLMTLLGLIPKLDEDPISTTVADAFVLCNLKYKYEF